VTEFVVLARLPDYRGTKLLALYTGSDPEETRSLAERFAAREESALGFPVKVYRLA